MDTEPEVKDPHLPWGTIVILAVAFVAAVYLQNHPHSELAEFLRGRGPSK